MIFNTHSAWAPTFRQRQLRSPSRNATAAPYADFLAGAFFAPDIFTGRGTFTNAPSLPRLAQRMNLLQHQLHRRVFFVGRIFVLAQDALDHQAQLCLNAFAR